MHSIYQKLKLDDFEYNPSLIDLHVHTNPASKCSRMTVDEYAGLINKRNTKIVSVTDHSNMEGDNIIELNDRETLEL